MDLSFMHKVPKVIHRTVNEDAYKREIEMKCDIVDFGSDTVWTYTLIIELVRSMNEITTNEINNSNLPLLLA